MDRFEELLKELGEVIDVPLHLDKHRACKINVNHFLNVQLEGDPLKERILMAAFLCDVPAGKFRENVFKDALKINNLYPRIGTLAYSQRNNKLALFEYVYFHDLNAKKLSEILSKFIDRGTLWKTAIEKKGQSSPSEEIPVKNQTGSIFDIKSPS